MFAHLNSIGLYGMDAFEVNVEADISNGLPGFDVVGLPDTAVKESRDRVRSALKNCGFAFPMSRITVNLAPADKRKEGPIYDLPILLAILTASGQLSCDLSDCAMIGELSLSGEIHGIRAYCLWQFTLKNWDITVCLYLLSMLPKELLWKDWKYIL